MTSLEKTLLVCSGSCDVVERCLAHAGCTVVKVKDGEEAVSQTMRHVFDAAVLVSTGPKMDLAETAFNLRDIRGTMDILIITGFEQGAQSVVAGEMLARSDPNTKALTVKQLQDLVGSLKKAAS